MVDQLLQSIGQHGTRNAEVPLTVLETATPQKAVTQNSRVQRSPITDNVRTTEQGCSPNSFHCIARLPQALPD